MPLDLATQRLVFYGFIGVLILILLADYLLCMLLGHDFTISAACQVLLRRWPICFVMLILWLGVLVGHLLPCPPR